MTILTDILAFIFILGAAVVLHEFGHFIVAKFFKIRVETFSFGFGPRLIGKKWGHTDYRISAIPLGGYVKLGGDESNSPIEGAGAVDIPENEMFNLRPRWQRICVALAGPVMNVLTALSIPFIGGMIYGVPLSPAPIVSYVEQSGAAQVAGLQPGDRIVSFNGTKDPNWDAINGDAFLSPNQALPMVIDRNGQRLSLTITPTQHNEDGDVYGSLDFLPDNGGFPVSIEDIATGSPAAQAGLKIGDRVLAINGDRVRSAEHISLFVRQHKGQIITLSVERGGQHLDISAKPKLQSDGVERIGVTPKNDFPLDRGGVVASAGHAVRSNVEFMRLTGKALGQVVARKRSVRNTLSGPIGIYEAASKSVERLGWVGVFSMLSFLSLNLGVFNLLPIPVLDGGAIFLMLIEGALALIGMTLSMTVRDRIQQVGFVVVILIMLFAVTNDLLKKFTSAPSEKPPAAAPK